VQRAAIYKFGINKFISPVNHLSYYIRKLGSSQKLRNWHLLAFAN